LGKTAAAHDVSPPPVSEPRPADPPGGLLRDLLHLFTRPGVLFADLARVNRLAAALLLLMALQALYGLAVLSTGVLDYEIEGETLKAAGQYANQPHTDESAEDVNRAVEAIEKLGRFNQMLNRVLLVAGRPVWAAAAAGLLASVLFVVVALRGTAKPDFQLLAAVAVFAAFVEVPRLLVRVFLVSQLQVSRVETSLAAFAWAPHVSLPVYVLLRRLDPFDVWYWALVGLGLWKTGQLGRRAAVVTVVVLALVTACLLASLDVAELGVYTPPPESP
jgi:hypothetical protein